MDITLFLPGAVVLLKAIFKLSIDRQFGGLAFIKGIISFPVDITFLSMSYVIAKLILGNRAMPIIASETVRWIIFLIIVYIVLAVLMSIACSKADRLYDAKRVVMAAALAASSYFLASIVLICSVYAV